MLSHTWTTLKVRALSFVVIYCSSSEPVHGWLTLDQTSPVSVHWPSFSPLATTSAPLSFTLWRLCCRRRRLPFLTTQQRRPSPRRFPGVTEPPTHSSNQACLVSLRSLINITSSPSPSRSSSLRFLPSFQVQYLPTDNIPNRETTTWQAAPRLLNRLAWDALQTARKEGYIKTATLADARTPGWSTSSTDTDYIKLDWFLSPSFPFLILSLSCARRPSSFSLTAYIFLMEASIYEVSEKIAPP